MKKKKKPIDKVRASRDGHEFHEAWAARRVLELLLPKDDLYGIAVEGTSPSDKKNVTSDTLEVADLTLYYGSSDQFEIAKKLEIIQFKYSIGKEKDFYRPTDAKKTLQKFSKSFKSYIRHYGVEKVKKKISFEIITNRPVLPDFIKAVEMLGSGSKGPVSKEVKSIVTQIQSATKLSVSQLKLFAGRLHVIGSAGTLEKNKKNLDRIVASWSIQHGDARARLGDLRELVRRKAGSAGDNNNLIRKEDLIETLGLADETVLLPCPESFPIVDHVFPREQLDTAVKIIGDLKQPLIIHAAGGVGKTVFLQTLASRLAEENEVILFDCFGGGSYRTGDDKRHLPKRGMLHIVNKLACLGLCDLILPGAGDSDDVMSMARKRLIQASESIQVTSPGKKLILILDAVDNAAVAAEDGKEDAFPKLLLESIHFKGAIPNLQIIASSRSHRVQRSVGLAKCASLQLNPFSKNEAAIYLRNHDVEISASEIEVAYARSDGNARILEHLVKGRKELLAESEVENKILLEDFLQKIINDAVNDSLTRGHSQSSIDAFLAGLAVLPLPIPISEYALAHGMDISEIESFASDLSPMLERTRYGLMFRDEPTETLIRERYGANVEALKGLASNLFKQQSVSDYAAKALPGLLVNLNDAEGLVSLAFSEAFPSSITSKVGQQAIRHSRISAALTNALNTKNYNDLVSLLLELSMIASINSRGADYILQNPDLVVASNDLDSKRRLFEIKTSWQGTRHSRLAIAHLLSGELGDAYNHGQRSWRWIDHYFRKVENERNRYRDHGPDEVDAAVTPLCLISQGNYKDAFECITEWKDWFSYNVACYVFQTLEGSNTFSPNKYDINDLITYLPKNVSICSAALSSLNLNTKTQKEILSKLARACQENADLLKDRTHDIGDRPAIVYGLIEAAGTSILLKKNKEAKDICALFSIDRPGIWAFTRPYLDERVSDYVEMICLKRLAEGSVPSVLDLLPKEIHSLLPESHSITESNYHNELKKYVIEHDEKRRKQHAEDKKNYYSYEERERSEKFLNHQLDLLLGLSAAFVQILKSPKGKADSAIKDFIRFFREKARDRTEYGADGAGFVGPMCKELFLYAIEVRKDLSPEIGAEILALVDQGKIAHVKDLIQLTSIFSSYDVFHEHAGIMATKAVARIENESEVTRRASDYASLARAIMPASLDEMTAYFRKGVEQVDMIGSGDYRFTNELLLFASEINGEELENQDLHILTNIAELNIDENDKFPWFAFGSGLGRVAGTKVLSKISRWDDRGKVKLTYTLLPSLIALVKYRKLDPVYALALVQLCDPSETWDWDYTTLVEEIFNQNPSDQSRLLDEILYKFEKDNPETSPENQIIRLLPLISRIKGKSSEEVLRWTNILNLSKDIRDETNYRYNYRNRGYPSKRIKPFGTQHKKVIERVLKDTNPTDLSQVTTAFRTMNEVSGFYQEETELFFARLREKVKFAARGKYLETVGSLQGVRLHSKLRELRACLTSWKSSSASHQTVLKSLGRSLISGHVTDVIHFDMSYVSTKDVEEISDITGIAIRDLLVELVQALKSGGYNVDAAIWISIATIFAKEVEGKVSKAALVRLLRSESAKLSSSVMDGGYIEGLYPDETQEQVVAGLVWKQLGSVDSSERWRAAHSIRFLARFGRWNIIHILVEKFDSTSAHSFQASELPFYYLHARLWLLVVLARVAKDYPKDTAKYRHKLEAIALSEEYPHVLMRNYAANAILNSIPLDLSPEEAELKLRLENINQSKLEPVNVNGEEPSGKRWNRPENKKKPSPEFHIDMDFDKYSVEPLCRVFGRPNWEIDDLLTAWVRKYDATIKSMYDDGGRDIRRDRSGEMDFRSHPYGYYLGWHAIQLTAGELLTKYPISGDDSYHDDPWNSWFGDFELTRKDGLWLSDGADRYPLDVRTHLMETRKKDLAITGNKGKLLNVLGITESGISDSIVINGSWKSIDGLNVHVTSAIVDPAESLSLATKLVKTKAFDAWLPTLEEYEEDGEFDRRQDENNDYIPWIVSPSSEAKLDKNDPYGVSNAASRLRLRKEIITVFDLTKGDAFGRTWIDKREQVVIKAEAWGHPTKHQDDREVNSRLIATSKFLKRLLKSMGSELILLVNLERYEESQRHDNKPSKFSNTTAVVLLNKNLEFEYFKGPVNQVLKNKY